MSDAQVQEGELSHGVDGSDCGIFLQSRLSPSTTLHLVDPYICFSIGLKSAFVSAFRVCSDANATAGVVLGLGVDGISKRPNTAIT